MNMLVRPVRSSLGSKYWMALTGLALIAFVLGHMVGNLLIFAGPDALNSYAQSLKDHPTLLWSVRLGLLTVFVLHIVLGIRLSLQNQAARPVGYAREETMQASWASRHMLLTGLLLLAFVVYHLAHFTFGIVHKADGTNYLDLAETRDRDTNKWEARPDLETARPIDPANTRHNVYAMVIAGFGEPLISLSYIVAMAFLALHLWHGGSSWLQSLGLASPRGRSVAAAIGPILAVAVFAGNCSIPLSVWLGIVK